MIVVGIIFVMLGIIGVFLFGLQALQDTGSYNFLGIETGLSTSSLTPVIISVVLLVIGAIITYKNQKEN